MLFACESCQWKGKSRRSSSAAGHRGDQKPEKICSSCWHKCLALDFYFLECTGTGRAGSIGSLRGKRLYVVLPQLIWAAKVYGWCNMWLLEEGKFYYCTLVLKIQRSCKTLWTMNSSKDHCPCTEPHLHAENVFTLDKSKQVFRLQLGTCQKWGLWFCGFSLSFLSLTGHEIPIKVEYGISDRLGTLGVYDVK